MQELRERVIHLMDKAKKTEKRLERYSKRETVAEHKARPKERKKRDELSDDNRI
jgi:hypothetical protein